MFRLRAPNDEQLQAHLERLAHTSPTYSEVGATRNEQPPSGFTHDRYHADLERGSFDRAVVGLKTWQAHLGAGVGVFPPTASLQVDIDVIVTAHVSPIYALAPCRIVYAIDEPDRFGFAYGTLPGHPECGEEAFIIERADDDRTTFSIVAFSRPADILAKVGRPIARKIQQRVTAAYLEALRDYAATTE